MANVKLVACAVTVLGGYALRSRRRPQLPQLWSHPADADDDGAGAWWVQDEELTYFPPSSLSQNVSHYYYALGPKSALSESHKQHRVGGRGQVHIFHLPKGSAVLEAEAMDAARGRSSSLSELQVLTEGARLGRFPEFKVPVDYQDPLGSGGLAAERAMMSDFTEASYKLYLEELTKSTSSRLKVSSRNTDNKEATKQTVGFLQEEFEALGATTCVQSFKSGRWRPRDIYNVIGFIRGTEAGSVTIGAHFDDLPGSGTAPGAEDDGSGTAGVLAALKAFLASGTKPKKSLYFVAFGGEEQGLIGSKRFAEELKRPGSSDSPIPAECRVSTTVDHTAFTMDMIGFRNPSFPADTVLIETKNWAKDQLVPPLALANQVNNAGRLKVTFSSNPFGSDHMSFLNNNLPATLLIDNDGATNKYPCYHRSCDSMDYINTRFAADIARMNLGAAMRIAGIN